MTKNFTQSRLLVFDLDGLIIDSLESLSKALLKVVKNLIDNENSFNEFILFDKMNPGLSRFEKIDFAMNLAKINKSDRRQVRSKCLDEFNALSLKARCDAKIDKNIFKFLDDSRIGTKFKLLTNCDKSQINQVVSHHGLDKIFGNEIHGTPPNKGTIFPTLVEKFRSESDNIFSISDSESDMEIAIENNVTFVLIKQFASKINFRLGANSLEFMDLNDFYKYLTQSSNASD